VKYIITVVRGRGIPEVEVAPTSGISWRRVAVIEAEGYCVI
jgi:hypothetical protein